MMTKVDREIMRYFRRKTEMAATMTDIAPGARLALRALKYIGSPVAEMKVSPLSESALPLAMLAEAESYCVEGPAEHGCVRETATGELPPRKAWLLEDCIATGWSSAFVQGERVVLPDQYVNGADRLVSDMRALVWHGQDGAAIVHRGRKPEQRDDGICLFGAGTFNWYHWLVEQLPAAFLSRRLGAEHRDIPLIVPEEAMKIDSFRDSLALFTRDRPVETIGAEPCRFKKLIVIDVPVEEPFNMRQGLWPSSDAYRFGPETMRGYRAAVIERLGIAQRAPKRRIFLARQHGRRGYNQEDVLCVASEFGLEAVYPEELSFAEQVQMMHDSEVVVGPSGAAFANTLFCQPGTQLLSWLIPEYSGFCSYTNIASITKSEIWYLFPPATTPIAGTRDAFRATYEVDLTQFRNALEASINTTRLAAK